MQFKDEYERAVTAQVGTVSTSGTNLQLGPRNVSHRVSPALMPDGHVLYTEWMHMGEVNTGHLRLMNTDMTGMKEAFGDELASQYPSTNSYLKARYVSAKPYMDPSGAMLDRLPGHRGRHLARSHVAVGQAVPHRSERQRGELGLAGPDAARPGRPHAELAGDRPLLRRRAGGRRGAGAVPDLLVGRPGPVGGARPRDEHRAVRHLRARRGRTPTPATAAARRSTTTRTTGTSWRAR